MWLKKVDLLVKQAAVQSSVLVHCEGFSEVVFVAVEIKQFWNDSVNVRFLIICLH